MARAPLRRRRWGWLVWLVVLGAGVFAARRAVQGRRQPAINVRVHRVEPGRVRDLVSTVASGRIAARREATVRAEIAGTVMRLHHRRGERVAAGEPLVSYDARELEHRVQVAEAAVALAHAQIAQAEAGARVARSNARRARGLSDHGVTPAAEVETLDGQTDIAERAATVSQVAVRQGLANVALARDALRRSVLRAPFDGIVLATMIEEGEVSAPAAPILTLADASKLHVDGELDESDLGRVALGMRGEVSLDAFPGQRFVGRLVEIAPSVSRDARGNRSVGIRVDLAADPRLRVGMSADVDVVVATRDDVLWIPPTAVLGRGTDRAVLVVDHDVARRRAITPGVATWEAIEVTRGIAAGDDVIVTLSAADLEDGARVVVRGRELTHGVREGSAR